MRRLLFFMPTVVSGFATALDWNNSCRFHWPSKWLAHIERFSTIRCRFWWYSYYNWTWPECRHQIPCHREHWCQSKFHQLGCQCRFSTPSLPKSRNHSPSYSPKRCRLSTIPGCCKCLLHPWLFHRHRTSWSAGFLDSWIRFDWYSWRRYFWV